MKNQIITISVLTLLLIQTNAQAQTTSANPNQPAQSVQLQNQAQPENTQTPEQMVNEMQATILSNVLESVRQTMPEIRKTMEQEILPNLLFPRVLKNP